MKSHARIVVIGGGVAGCSTLFHLTREGETDVVLVERDELTSGTTWHSAAQVTQFGAIQVMVGLKRHSPFASIRSWPPTLISRSITTSPAASASPTTRATWTATITLPAWPKPWASTTR